LLLLRAVGLSKKFLSNDIGVMHEGVGTLYSMSPQVLQGVYTSQADLWSCGVITYMLLSSHLPFYHEQRQRMIEMIMWVDYSFEKDYWKPISDEAKDFVDELLVLDPDERMDAGEALNHVWLSKEFPKSDRIPDQTTADAVQGGLVQYKEVSELKKIALNVRGGCLILKVEKVAFVSQLSMCCSLHLGHRTQVDVHRNTATSKGV
jgi:calcium-dependent protein kinase